MPLQPSCVLVSAVAVAMLSCLMCPLYSQNSGCHVVPCTSGPFNATTRSGEPCRDEWLNSGPRTGHLWWPPTPCPQSGISPSKQGSPPEQQCLSHGGQSRPLKQLSSKGGFSGPGPVELKVPACILVGSHSLCPLVADPEEAIYDDVPRENSDSEPGLPFLDLSLAVFPSGRRSVPSAHTGGRVHACSVFTCHMRSAACGCDVVDTGVRARACGWQLKQECKMWK